MSLTLNDLFPPTVNVVSHSRWIAYVRDEDDRNMADVIEYYCTDFEYMAQAYVAKMKEHYARVYPHAKVVVCYRENSKEVMTQIHSGDFFNA